jgi:hypothetical protein
MLARLLGHATLASFSGATCKSTGGALRSVFLGNAQRHEDAAPSRALKGHQSVAQGKQGAGAPRAALGQRSDKVSPLPRIAQRGRFGGEIG